MDIIDGSEQSPQRCGCGGEFEHGWNPDGTDEVGYHCVSCGYAWDPSWGISYAQDYAEWRAYLADMVDDLPAI